MVKNLGILIPALFQVEEGEWACGIQAGDRKDAVGSIHRMQLVAAVSAVRLVGKVKEFLKIRIREVKYFTDTSCVLTCLVCMA